MNMLISNYPSNVIPKSGDVIIGVDLAKDGTECTVKGFFDRETNEYHIQEVEYVNKSKK